MNDDDNKPATDAPVEGGAAPPEAEPATPAPETTGNDPAPPGIDLTPPGGQPSEGELAARRAAFFETISNDPKYRIDPDVARQRKLWLAQRQALCVRVCEEIMVEGIENVPGIESIAQRYEGLTKPLERKGWDALKPVDGTPRLVSQLRAEMPWCENAITLIEQQCRLALYAGRPWLALRPMLLVGPPGCGKSHLARRLGELASTGVSVLDFGGISDSRTIEGTARGWTGAQPCYPAIAMLQAKAANPVIIVEEVDKAGGSSQNGNSLAVLLTMIERHTAAAYYDKCLMTDIDLSHINWVLTANDASRLPRPLLSRLDVVHVPPPRPEHFEVLLGQVIAKLARHWQLSLDEMPPLTPKAHAVLQRRFARNPSVRRLARDVELALAAVVPMLGTRVQ